MAIKFPRQNILEIKDFFTIRLFSITPIPSSFEKGHLLVCDGVISFHCVFGTVGTWREKYKPDLASSLVLILGK